MKRKIELLKRKIELYNRKKKIKYDVEYVYEKVMYSNIISLRLKISTIIVAPNNTNNGRQPALTSLAALYYLYFFSNKGRALCLCCKLMKVS